MAMRKNARFIVVGKMWQTSNLSFKKGHINELWIHSRKHR